MDQRGLDHAALTQEVQACHNAAYASYQSLLQKGVARELARMVLPVSIFTEVYVNCDLHNLIHFLQLREDDHAQQEIREMAAAMRQVAEQLYPWTFEAFHKYRLGVTDRPVSA